MRIEIGPFGDVQIGDLGDNVANALYGAAFLGFFVFLALYLARSNWQATEAGRALLYAIASLNIVVLQSTIHQFTGPYPGIWITRSISGLFILFASWHLVYALVRLQGPITFASFFLTSDQRGALPIITKGSNMADQKQITPSNEGVPTQVANPKRASLRTLIQTAASYFALANIGLPVVSGFLSDHSATLSHYLGSHYGQIVLIVNGAGVIVSGGAHLVTRLMAFPAVNAWITKWAPGLAAIAPAADPVDDSEATGD